MQQPSNTIIGITVIVILLALYSLRNNRINKIDDEEVSVSLCQIHVQYDESNIFDDRTLLSLLAVFKMHDFQISQPVWGPPDTLIYLCEHRLKTGLKQIIIDKKLNTIIKNSGTSSSSLKRLVWSCA